MGERYSARPVMHGAYVALLLSGVQDRPEFVRRALDRCAIPVAILHDPALRITVRQFGQLMTTLTAITGDELSGLGTTRVRPGTFATLCRILALAPTVETALRLGCDFYRSVTDDFSVRLSREGGARACLVVRTRPVRDDRGFMLHSIAMFFAYGLTCWLAGRRIPVELLDLAIPERIGTAYASQVFRASDIRYSSGERTRIVFDPSWLDHPVAADELRIDSFIATLPAGLLLGYRDDRTTSEQLRVLLRRQVAAPPDLEQAAGHLGMSTQTLRRQLRQENLTYQGLKDEVRFGVAAEMLADSSDSVEQVGRKLGFAELSSFHRAFKRWTGHSPGQHRRGLS